MENEEALLSLIELTNLSIEEAKRYLSEAGNILEVAIQNYYDSQQGEFPQDPQQPEEPQYDEYENEVRPAIPREFDQLVEEESVRNMQLNRVKRQFSSSFRDLKKEMEIQENLAKGIAPKRKCLEDIYRNPIDITYNLDMHSAKALGQKQGKWIALLINDETFASLSFNRDIFNDQTQKVKQIIKKNFILLRKNANSDESLRILHNYNLIHQTIPIFLVIDSLTGELKKNFGETKDLTLKTVVRELRKYTASEDKQLSYNSDVPPDSDDDIVFAPSNYSAGSSNILKSQTKTSLKPSTASKKPDESDSEESFASISSDDIANSDHEELKVLDSDDDAVNSPAETQTNILLKLQDQNHNFKYPSKRTVANLINYIYRNYLIQTGIYDDKRKRFSLFSKVHNKCLTSLDQTLNLEESNIHPSCVLMHNTLDKE